MNAAPPPSGWAPCELASNSASPINNAMVDYSTVCFFPLRILPLAVEPRISIADGAAQRNHRKKRSLYSRGAYPIPVKYRDEVDAVLKQMVGNTTTD